MNFLMKLFVNEWKIILEDNLIQLFINDEPIKLNMTFNADAFLKDQSQFIANFKKALTEVYKNYALVRPRIKLVLRGKLKEHQKSSIFQSTFVFQNIRDERIGARSLLIE